MNDIPCNTEGNFFCRDDISTNVVVNNHEIATDEIELLMTSCDNEDIESERIYNGVFATER